MIGPSSVRKAVRFDKPNRPGTMLEAVPIDMGVLIDTL